MGALTVKAVIHLVWHVMKMTVRLMDSGMLGELGTHVLNLVVEELHVGIGHVHLQDQNMEDPTVEEKQ